MRVGVRVFLTSLRVFVRHDGFFLRRDAVFDVMTNVLTSLRVFHDKRFDFVTNFSSS